MKAVVYTEYGSPDVLKLTDVAKPVPRDDEVLIRVYAAAAGPVDSVIREGNPRYVRLVFGLKRPRITILGSILAGEIEAVGSKVTRFKAGDQVFGLSTKTFGAYAEYKCLPEAGVVATKSANMTYADAVGVVDGATTALTFLRDTARIQRGQKILINGASGAVGAYAVQLARAFGAEVTGVCGAANVALVKSLGADQVIDYTRQDFTKTGQTYDIIFDAVGKSSFSLCQGLLTQKGVYLTTAQTLTILSQMLWTSASSGKKAKFVTAGLMQRQENLVFLNELFESGELKSVIDRCYPLEQTAEAHRYVDTGHKKGNVVITLGSGNKS